MSIKTYLDCVNQLHNVLSSLANGDVEWVLTDRERVLFTSAKASEVLGISQGTGIKENVWLEETLSKEIRITRSQRGWRGNKDFRCKIVGLPLRDESEKVDGVLLYATAEQTLFKPEDILGLLQEINHEKDMESALKILTRRSLDIFNVSVAGIWLLQESGLKLLAISACDSEQEDFLRESLFPSELSIFENNDPQACLEQKMILQDLEDLNGVTPGENEPAKPFTAWTSKLLEFGVKRLLCIPLLHFGQLLGVFTLFGSEEASFDGVSIHWLTQLIPLISSFVYEQQMRMAAVEREQALTLLLWGTEILVQAESEEHLLTEAGEMAMILYIEAGFFFIQEENGWEIKAPFGRLKQNDDNWEEWLFGQMKINPKEEYIPHQEAFLSVLDSVEESEEFPWRKVFIQPIRTHNGLVGELWLLDYVDKVIEQRQEIAAFVRGLGVALETITQRRELERLATTDSLTGILNRQGFEQRIREEMAGTLRRGSSFILLIFDLDGFKILNDTQGHPVGDQALSKISHNLRLSVREQDIVARTGGDEFTVVLTDLKRSQESLQTIERLKERMGLEEFGLGVSIGVSEFPTEANEYEGLYRIADQRLYQGKYSGKGKIIMED